jgi:hypothetical protein
LRRDTITSRSRLATGVDCTPAGAWVDALVLADAAGVGAMSPERLPSRLRVLAAMERVAGAMLRDSARAATARSPSTSCETLAERGARADGVGLAGARDRVAGTRLGRRTLVSSPESCG